MATFREAKKDRTRQQLIEAAFDLYMKKGFTQTSIDEISLAANVSRRSFFRYFATKGDLILSWYKDLSKSLCATLEARPSDEPIWEALEITFASLITPYEANPQHMKSLAIMFNSTPQILQKKHEAIRIWKADLLPCLLKRVPDITELDARNLLYKSIATFEAAFDYWFSLECDHDLRAIIHSTFQGANDEEIKLMERADGWVSQSWFHLLEAMPPHLRRPRR